MSCTLCERDTNAAIKEKEISDYEYISKLQYCHVWWYVGLSGKSCKLKSKLVTLGSNGVFTLPFGLLENLPDCPILYQPTSLSVRLSRTLRHLYKVPEGHDASVAQGGALLPSSQGSGSPIALTQRISITTRGPRICLLIKDESAKI